MTKEKISFIIPIVLCLVLGCGILFFILGSESDTPEPTPEVTETVEPTATPTPDPTATPEPSESPEPTQSAEVVDPTPAPTPVPTKSPSPTKSPEPKTKVKYMIKVNKAANVVTIYKSEDGGDFVPKRAFLCSGGNSTPTGSFTLSNKWRWLWMVDDSYGQWVSQITGNYLFHSVPYWGTQDPDQLDVGEYNKLGTTCSHGCIRLRAGDAKWIYDNMPIGTKIVIYEDSSDPGPLGKPSVDPLPDWHTWDPTDPNMKYKCEEKGCH